MMADQEMMATIMVDDGLMKRNVLIGCNIMVWCSSNDGIIMIKCQKTSNIGTPNLNAQPDSSRSECHMSRSECHMSRSQPQTVTS